MRRNGLGTYVRERRMEMGLTQEQLAERIGETTTQAEVSRLERGHIILPRRDRMEALAEALQVSLGSLLIHSGWLTADEGEVVDRLPTVGERNGAAVDASILEELAVLREVLLGSIERITSLEALIRDQVAPVERPSVIMHTGVFDDWESTTVFVY